MEVEVKFNVKVIPKKRSFKHFGLIIQENEEIDDDVSLRIIGVGMSEMKTHII